MMDEGTIQSLGDSHMVVGLDVNQDGGLVPLNFTNDNTYLFGISLQRMSLKDVYRTGQIVRIPNSPGSVEWGAYFGSQKTGIVLTKQLTAYCKKYDILPHVEVELLRRADVISSQEDVLLTEAPLPETCQPTSSSPMSASCQFSCSNTVGTVVSVQNNSGVVNVNDVDLQFSDKHVFLFAVPLQNYDLTMFLEPGLHLYVYAKNGKVKSAWMGSNRSVTSLNIVTDMRRFCECRGVDDDLISLLEAEMFRLYNMMNGNTAVEVLQERCQIQSVHEKGGVVVSQKVCLSFTTDNVRVHAIPLSGVRDLSMFLEIGQSAFVDVKGGRCTTVWIATERSVHTREVLGNMMRYCRARNVPDYEIAALETRYYQLKRSQTKDSKVSTPAASSKGTATILSLHKDQGQLMYEGKLFNFKKRQFILFGYNLGLLDLNLVNHKKFNVNVEMKKGVLDKVWVGSLEKSREGLQRWIQSRLPRRAQDILLKHWSLGTSAHTMYESSESSLLDNMDSSDISVESVKFWAPSTKLNDEKSVCLVGTPVAQSEESMCEEESEVSSPVGGNSHPDNGAKGAQCDVKEDLTGIIHTAGNDYECSLKDHLTHFLVREKLVNEYDAASKLSDAFACSFGEFVRENFKQEEEAGMSEKPASVLNDASSQTCPVPENQNKFEHTGKTTTVTSTWPGSCFQVVSFSVVLASLVIIGVKYISHTH